MAKDRPRVPLPVASNLFDLERTLQVNHCRQPTCENFTVPARHRHGKKGLSPDRDMRYVIYSRGSIASLRCKSCQDVFPMKSNAAILSEVERLTAVGGLQSLEESSACRTPECENRDRPVASNRRCYQKRGKSPGGGQYYRCKACGRFMLLSDPVRLHEKHQSLAADVFSRIANKTPMRRTVRGAGLKSNGSYYAIFDFIHSRCRAYSGAFDRALIDGRLRLPREIHIEADAQTYTLNWVSRLDRRNVELSSYCGVDSASRFVFGLHANFDPGVDPFQINKLAAEQGDLHTPEAFREHPQYWLAGDEANAGRAMSRGDVDHEQLIAQIETLYQQAASRKDVENIELEQLDTSYKTPFLRDGLQIHMPYTAYAHWMLTHRILTGAGVEKVQANVDLDSMSRAAFLCAFAEEVKRGDAHLFYVRFRKYLTVDKRRQIVEKSRRAFYEFAKTLPAGVRKNRQEVARRLMKDALRQGHRHGQWSDEWFDHPLPTMNEPEKAMSWMTPDDTLSEGRKADMFLRAGLARADNVFQMTRRLINAFERPIGTTGGRNTVWHGYAPYNPEMVQKYLTIFRTINNFVVVGEETDGKTPAMRLGFAREPLRYEDMLWPGERVPRPKRTRRKGRAIAV